MDGSTASRLGVRYLLTGGADRPYAVSVQAIVEAPTGDTRLVRNATQVMPAVLELWRPMSQVVVYSNLTFDHSIGGTGPSVAFLEYKSAVTWRATIHFAPAFEFVGSTNPITDRTELVAVPEVILRAGPHLEWKTGLQVGLNAETPEFGLRAQLAWSWGKRDAGSLLRSRDAIKCRGSATLPTPVDGLKRLAYGNDVSTNLDQQAIYPRITRQRCRESSAAAKRGIRYNSARSRFHRHQRTFGVRMSI